MSTNDATTKPEPQVDAYFEGVIDRGSERKVAFAVNVNMELQDGQKQRGHACPIHVIPLMRRMHPGGVVTVKAKWARNIPRTAELTQQELKNELEGLTNSYGKKLPGQAASYLAEVYGATEADQLRNLHAKMRDVYLAWKKLEAKGLQRVKERFPGQSFSTYALHGIIGDVLTDDEMNELVALIEPEREELEEIQLPDLEAITAEDSDEGAESGETDEDATEWLTAELVSRLKLSEQDAISITALVIDCGDLDPDEHQLATIKGMQKGDGTLHGKKGEQLKLLLAAYRKKLASAAATPA